MGHLGFRPLGDRHERMLLARLNEEALDRPEVDQLVSFSASCTIISGNRGRRLRCA
jgi:hypothetical protein